MDHPWRDDDFSPSSACEVAPYEILDPERLAAESSDLQTFTKSIAEQPYDPESWLLRGRCLRLLGFPELALGDAYKARLLVEASQERSTPLGKKSFLALCDKTRLQHEMDLRLAAWKHLVSTTELLEKRVLAELQELELQVWSELMEGLMASNACSDYLTLSKEAVLRFPQDAVFPSEVLNAKSWFKQRDDILREQVDAGEMSEEKMQATLHNGGVYPVPYPWMQEDFVSREESFLDGCKAEFSVRSTNSTVSRSAIRDIDTEDDSPSSGDVLGAFATKSIAGADTVLVDSTVAGVTSSAERCPTCCGRITEEILNDCCSVPYCSPDCSKTALDTFHASICGKDFGFLTSAAESAELTTDLSLDSVLLLRVLALSMQEPTLHPLKTSLLNRLTPTYKNDELIIFNFPDHIVTPIRVLGELGIDVFANAAYDTWVLHTIRCRLQNNKHGQTLDGFPGTAVNPLYSMFNHSCAPNVDWEHGDSNSTLRMFALRDVDEGEELFISYIRPLTMEYAERQESLLPWLGMECECERCKAERPPSED
ncbi:hypothetical protein V502_04861 [Pseudogymnoascus sp. VKM F-4520 (FW-2644)]|nr:hypothetical protein V502_04861 [Pseudogymnoascus sp. VKM F-4520 (FW-2644)]